METKIRVETIRKETPIYVAIDGTEFYDKEVCEHYEQDYLHRKAIELRNKATEAYNALPKVSINPAEDILDLGWSSERYEYVYVRNEKDVETIKEYLSYEDKYNLSINITNDNIGSIVGSIVLIISDKTGGYAFLVNETYDEYMECIMKRMLSIKSEISDLINKN